MKLCPPWDSKIPSVDEQIVAYGTWRFFILLVAAIILYQMKPIHISHILFP